MFTLIVCAIKYERCVHIQKRFVRIANENNGYGCGNVTIS